MTRWITTAAAVVVLVVGLTACRDHGLDSTSDQSTPSVATSVVSNAPAGAGAVVAATPPPTTAAVNPSAALAQINADLSGISVATSQASGDLGAGDSARTQPDDGN